MGGADRTGVGPDAATAAEIGVVTDEISDSDELGVPTVAGAGAVLVVLRRRRIRRRTVRAGSRGGDVAAPISAEVHRPLSLRVSLTGDDVLVGDHSDWSVTRNVAGPNAAAAGRRSPRLVPAARTLRT